MLGVGVSLMFVYALTNSAAAHVDGGDQILLAVGGFLCLGEAFFGWLAARAA